MDSQYDRTAEHDEEDGLMAYNSDDYYDDKADGDYYDEAEFKKVSAEQYFTVLKESDIIRLQHTDIAEVSSVLSISTAAATVLLHHFRWNASKVLDAWFADEEKVRNTAGLLKESQIPPPNSKTLTCEICFVSYSSIRFISAACGHPYCTNCWKQYVNTAIADGPACLQLRCPEPSCVAAVGEDMIHQLANKENSFMYDQFVLQSYVESSKKLKWCPGAGCEFAVSFDAGSANNPDVICLCSHRFCWNCGEDAHRPVDCDTVAKWIQKNNSESENTNWVLAYTKPCPKCKRAIEKNMGCMHMTCRAPCGFQFCWLCLRDWSECCKNSCNRYRPENEVLEQKAQNARKHLDRYTHYYERWASNSHSRTKALRDLNNLKAKHLKKLSCSQGVPETVLEFLTEAWLQVVECRRVLKWTYAYGYYLPEDKREFFEYTQGEAERALERLHQCSEVELRKFLDVEEPHDEFNAFRLKLLSLTRVTKDYFENLVKALENGLGDVHVGGKKKGTRGRGESSSSNGREARRRVETDDVTNHDLWPCRRCTYINVATATRCLVCNTVKRKRQM